MKKVLPVLLLMGVVIVFFWQLFIKGFLPIPSDTIVGLYYPFRDAYFKTNPNGLPYKNFLVTDPVRQQIPWKTLSVLMEKAGELPIWNPYTFAGTPLLANFQSGALYPLNVLFFILPFNLSWSFLILLEPLLAGIFLYLYLSNLELKKSACFLGSISFSFSGFFIAWLEWGNILHTALWLPLILLSIDKIISYTKDKTSKVNIFIWSIVFLFSLVSSFFAGHLQIFVYLIVLSAAYFLVRLLQSGKRLKTLGIFLVLAGIFLILILPQLIPGIKFISLSARNLDLPDWRTNPGWFIPWQNLLQFIAPDFFGNPATLNYYGIWNYGEFIGFIGIVPLIFSFVSLFFRKDKKTFFFGCVLFLSLILSLPTIFAKIPFKFDIPFLSTAQPTRLMYLIDFSLSVLAALGVDYFISSKNKKEILYVLGIFGLLFAILWAFILFFHGNVLSTADLAVSKQNLILPTGIFILVSLLIVIGVFSIRKFDKNKLLILNLTFGSLILITAFDLLRFGLKFEPFTNQNYLFPSTSVTAFLEKQKGPFRMMSSDSKIFPPNFSIIYKIQTLDGYDPLYLRRYAELMAASGRNAPDFKAPFGFNRIITPHDFLSPINDLLNVKYVLSLNEIKDTKVKEVFSDGVVKVYENLSAFPRAFFVNSTYLASSKQDAINAMFDKNYPLNRRAIVEDVSDRMLFKSNWDLGKVEMNTYSENRVILTTQTPGEAFLVLTDSYYPTWYATIDGRKTRIYLTDFNFRGIIVPAGKHIVEFQVTLF